MINALTVRQAGSTRWTSTFLIPLFGTGLIGSNLACSADTPPPPKPNGGSDELALFSDLPLVVSASRQQTIITRSGVPVSVLSDEDLSAGGHDRLEEALRFVPGMDVQRIDRNHYAVGVHGFHGSFSDRTLTMIDGRNADSPVFGGAEFYRQPLVMDDIDHVEVVRGPGGAAWGANAFNGVINVITKDPEDMLGIHASTQVNGFGDTADSARWCDSRGALSWKIGAFYERHVSSSEALNDSSYADNDWGKKIGTDNSVVWRINDSTTVRGGIGFANVESGVFEFLGYQPPGQDELDTTRAFLRVDQRLSKESSYRLDWYGNFLTSHRPAALDERSRENVAEFQFDYHGIADHQFSLGGEWRMTDINQLSAGVPPEFDLANAPYHEQRYGVFAIDKWQAHERISIEAQIRADYYDGTSSDWAGRLACIYGLDRDQKNLLRLACARAYRTPLPALRDATTNKPPFFNLIASDHLKNEHTWSVEAGYSGEFQGDFLARVDLYHQRYEDLIGFTFLPNFDTQAKNIDGANGDGGEIEFTWVPMTTWSSQRARLSAWYAYNRLETDRIDQEIRAFTPAENKVGVTTRLPLPQRFAFNLNYAFTGSSNDPDLPIGTHVSIHHQCDITLAWALPQHHGELMIGVWDVFHQTDDPIAATGTSLPHNTPGQTFFIRGVLDF